MTNISYFVLVLIFNILLAQEAYAYFDPGTASMLLQVMVALLGGALIFYRRILFEAKKITG